MDESQSPASQSDDPAALRTGAPDDGADKDEPSSILSRLLGRALGNGSDEDYAHLGREALGPAFRSSSPAELAMVMNILRLRDLRVADVMIPRADIVAVAEDADLDAVMEAFKRGSLSRLPVYRETLDDPIGFVHLKDLALAYGVGGATGDKKFCLRDHIRTALFVPPSMRIAALLQRMQGSRVHMALVIDEFGGVDGLVTIEDLVEQIVGDIEDEHDQDDIVHWREEAPGIYLLDARTDIHEFEEATGISLLPEEWEEDVDTLGGLVFMLTGRVPARGEVIAHPGGHEFLVVDADPRRVKRLRFTALGSNRAAGLVPPKAAE